ncbi:MAG: HDIG domain-containing metalloprotein [Candidatus Margulisiibacteriota bacterium]|nr:HDIG domain-containing metalloprotein [Candidatus Margulisiibacteriota bacterium]
MFSGFQKNKNFISVLFSILGALLIAYITYSPRLPLQLNIQLGDISSQTIRSPQYIEFQTKEDIEKTNELRLTRRKLIRPIYSIDSSIQKKINESIIIFFTTLRLEGKDALKNPYNFLNNRYQNTLLSLSQTELIELESRILQTISIILQTGIKEINVSSIKEKIYRINTPFYSKPMQQLVASICLNFLTPNLIIDEQQTQDIINQQMAAIQPFLTSFKSGQIIIAKGDVFSEFHIDALKALKLYGSKNNQINFLGIFIITALLFVLFERFLYFFYKKLHQQTSTYILVFTLMLLTLSIARLIFSLPPIKYIDTLYFLIPLPVMIILLCILLTPNIAMISGTITAILISLMYQNNLFILVFLFFATCTTTFSCYKIYKRSDLVLAGNIIGIINILVIISIGIMSDINNIIWYLYNTIIGFSNGFLCAMLSFAFLPYFESFFRITTSLGLLETANLNHPLLKKLLLNAPGTYQHSLMVANLSEAAAEAIGADVILSRIGAYFHDIGKMKRPIFFSENQFSSSNPHDNLSPRMSKIIIAAHGKDGVEMAQKYKLPQILQDFMMQHHGTSLVSFFYDVAKKEVDEESSGSLEEDFRYPGPKPQTKEAGILMLADTTEAAIRSIDKPTPTKIENLIEKVFINKITDNQLNESSLSLNDIQKIKETFMSIFKSIYHSRLDYEDELNKIIDHTKSKFNEE